METKTNQTEWLALQLLTRFISALNQANGCTSDLDEVHFEEKEELVDYKLITTEIVDGSRLSFTCWYWTDPAKRLAKKFDVNLPEDSTQDRDLEAEWEK